MTNSVIDRLNRINEAEWVTHHTHDDLNNVEKTTELCMPWISESGRLVTVVDYCGETLIVARNERDQVVACWKAEMGGQP